MSAPRPRLLLRFVSNAGLYGISLMFTRIGWLALLPIYWTKLDPSDYGIIGVAQLVQIVMGPIFSLGLYDAVLRFYSEWDEKDRAARITTLWLVSMAWSLVVLVLLVSFGGAIFGRIFSQIPFEPYLQIAIFTAFLTNIGMFPLAIYRIREEALQYSLITIGIFTTQAIVTIIFVVALERGVFGYLLGMMLGAGVWAVYFLWTILRQASFWVQIQWSHAVAPLRYSLPIVPVAILDGTASLFDRIFLDKYAALAQIGLYNLGNQFGNAFNAFNQVLKASWVPFLYRITWETADGSTVLARFSVYYLGLLAIPALGVALLSKELIEWFGDSRYHDVYFFVPWFVLIYYVQAMSTALGRGLDLANKTGYWLIVSVLGFATSIVALSLLVPSYGALGAIVAVLIGGTVRAIVQIALAHFFYPRPFHGIALLRLGVFAMITFTAGYHADFGSTLVNACVKMLIVTLGGSAILWVTLGGQACRKALVQSAQSIKRYLLWE